MKVKNSNKHETIYLLLGSNLDDRMKNILEAKRLIDELGDVTNESSIYITKAWGNEQQNDFLNQAIEVNSNYSPLDLLARIKEIERRLGRTGEEKWSPRTIDIDILFYGGKIIQLKDLAIPHPLMRERRFVLKPLAEIAAHFVHPVLKVSVAELLEVCLDTLDVRKYNG